MTILQPCVHAWMARARPELRIQNQHSTKSYYMLNAVVSISAPLNTSNASLARDLSELIDSPLLNKAKTLEKAIQNGSTCEQEEISSTMEDLAKRVLSPSAHRTFCATSNFYNQLSSYPAMRNRISASMHAMANDICKIDSISIAICAGQLATDQYDPSARRFLALMDLMQGKINETTFSRRDIPDFDIITIICPDVSLPLQPENEEQRRMAMRQVVQKHPLWHRIRTNWENRHWVSTIKFTSALEERIGNAEAFQADGKIPVCLCNPIPAQLWQKLDLLFEAGDSKYLNCLRDFLFGVKFPDLISPYPNFMQQAWQQIELLRINTLLSFLEKGGPSDIECLLKYVFKQAEESMPERPKHSAAPGLVAYARQNWQTTVNKTAATGLITTADDATFRINACGKELVSRNRLFREAFIEAKLRSPARLARKISLS